MNICIVGGGHIGTTLACYIKYNKPEYNVAMFTRRPGMFSRTLTCNDIEGDYSFSVELDCISDDPSVAAKNADIVFFALPHFAVEKAFSDVCKYVSKSAFIGVIPGGGGCEFFFNKYFDKTHTLFGFQRVPFTAKLVKYGNETNLKSWKPYSVVGAANSERIDIVCKLVESCGLKTKKAPNYLSVALTPTNPILHTSRTYEIFGKYRKDYIFGDICKYYVGWTNKASEIMLAMDKELHALLDGIPELDTSAIRPLTEHYESYTIQEMTRKINSIPTFQSVYAPMKKNASGSGFIADLSSRMFTEDFPWGLLLFRAYCEIIGTKAPTMDMVLQWYADYMGLEWYINGKLCGKDLKNTGIPQVYGICTKEKLLETYL